MPRLYKSKSRGLKELAYGKAGSSFKRFGKATEKIVEKAGGKAYRKKRRGQQVGALLAGLLLTIATGGAAAPLLMAGATGLGSYFGGRTGAKEGEKYLEGQLGQMSVDPVREASEELSGSLYEGLVTDAVKDAFMSYAGGKFSQEGIQGLMPKQVPTVNPVTGTPVMAKQGLPFFDKLPTAESVGGQKLIGVEESIKQSIMKPKMIETPNFLENLLGLGEQININPFVTTKPLEKGLGFTRPTLSMFGRGAKESLPMIFPQLLSMYEGRQ